MLNIFSRHSDARNSFPAVCMLLRVSGGLTVELQSRRAVAFERMVVEQDDDTFHLPVACGGSGKR